ncbi:transmembrane protein, putative [Medicago truncatula]|uniref:Transmembrane protein, putative n=1 Tax=Medicago truncatula TaxID=3880 RepID=G7LHK0_MEDTR|nr:transmembrane protein, putative [Medicago truncatula]
MEQPSASPLVTVLSALISQKECVLGAFLFFPVGTPTAAFSNIVACGCGGFQGCGGLVVVRCLWFGGYGLVVVEEFVGYFFGYVGLWCFVVVSMVVLVLGLLWWCSWWFLVVMLVVAGASFW